MDSTGLMASILPFLDFLLLGCRKKKLYEEKKNIDITISIALSVSIFFELIKSLNKHALHILHFSMVERVVKFTNKLEKKKRKKKKKRTQIV